MLTIPSQEYQRNLGKYCSGTGCEFYVVQTLRLLPKVYGNSVIRRESR
jgi:hypothetical protein